MIRCSGRGGLKHGSVGRIGDPALAGPSLFGGFGSNFFELHPSCWHFLPIAGSRFYTGSAQWHSHQWHISMRIQHVENALKGLLQTEGFSGISVLFKRPAETLRWYLWHGKVMTATTSLQWLMVGCAQLTADDRRVAAAVGRVQVRCRDLYSYFANSMDSLTDHGRRHRAGLPISSSRADGCVDDISNTCIGKRRRLRWSPKGANSVAVVHTAVLDGRLTAAYQRAA